SKTFNIPGLGLSSLIVPDPVKRRKILKVMDLLHVSNNNPFSITAFEAAYKGGDAWLDALLVYLDGNRKAALDFIARRLPQVRAANPQGTYLLWLDCRNLGLVDTALRDFFIRDCALGLSPGIDFGEPGSGFMRMNLGAPRAVVEQALTPIDAAMVRR